MRRTVLHTSSEGWRMRASPRELERSGRPRTPLLPCPARLSARSTLMVIAPATCQILKDMPKIGFQHLSRRLRC